MIQKSSNVGAAKIALSLPREEMHALFRRVGFGAAPRLGFPGEAAGRLREAKTWRPIEQATMAFGHGISVSLIQLARAYTVFARDGELAPLSLLKTDAPAAGQRVFSPEVARALRAMLGQSGAARRYRAARARHGLACGRQDGTAHKQETAATRRTVRLLVCWLRAGLRAAAGDRGELDEPSAGQYYGGQSRPVFSQVMQGALRLRAPPMTRRLRRSTCRARATR